MGLICYEPSQCFALADEPELRDKEIVEREAPQPDGPVKLKEWGTYYLTWFGDKPDFVDRLPMSPFAARQDWSGQIREINFNNYVGLARIGSLHVLVENRKIGDHLYHALLDNVADHYADLIFGFSQDPVGHGFQRKGAAGRNLAYVEYLFLRRYLLTEEIEGVVAAILRNPHASMLRETHSVPLALARATDPVALLSALSRGDHITLLEPGHELCSTPLGLALPKRGGQTLFPCEVPEERRYHTYDTHENRFAKHVLVDLERRLDDVNEVARQHTGGLVNPEIGSDLVGLKCKVSGCLDDPFWQEVGSLHFFPLSSPVLQRREGYRQLYRLHALLQLLTRYDYELFDFANLLETKDTATLYEYWCFFQVKEVLDTHLQRKGAEQLVHPSDSRQEMELGACLTYEGGLSLCFNWTAGGSPGFDSAKTIPPQHVWGTSSAGQFRPDIVIKYAGRHLIFDAKNKGLRSNAFYGAQEDGTICKPKPEDLVKMHAYRDAINCAQGAFALFPGTESRLYPSHGATQPWDGIGALALRPDTSGRPEPYQIRDLKAIIFGFIESGL